MSVNELVLAQGLRDTRGALERWRDDPWPVIRSWVLGALAVAILLLGGVLLVATLTTPDETPLWVAGLTHGADAEDTLPILFRNSLVLALHATACVAGFIAGSSLTLAAEKRHGFSRWIHEKARPVALGWVVAVTCFSLLTQAFALGLTGGQLANQFDIAPATLVLTVLPHAVPELVALFLPLAAWTIASRRNEWHDLLAATFVTVALAVPVLLFTAAWEVWIWPRILIEVSPYALP